MNIIFVTALFVVAVNGDFCSLGPPGRYCNDQSLSGYYDCQPDGSSNIVQCSAGTRCSCYLNNRCPEEGPVCKSFDLTSVPRLEGNFVVKIVATQTVTSPQGSVTKPIQIVVRQNTDHKRFIWTEYGERTNFLLVIPEEAKFAKYEGSFTSCTKKVIPTFEGFLNELNHFTNTKIEGNVETYYFQNGRRNSGSSLETWTWELETGTSKLKKFRHEELGSANSKTDTTTESTSISQQTDLPSEAWFRIPEHCKNL